MAFAKWLHWSRRPAIAPPSPRPSEAVTRVDGRPSWRCVPVRSTPTALGRVVSWYRRDRRRRRTPFPRPFRRRQELRLCERTNTSDVRPFCFYRRFCGEKNSPPDRGSVAGSGLHVNSTSERGRRSPFRTRAVVYSDRDVKETTVRWQSLKPGWRRKRPLERCPGDAGDHRSSANSHSAQPSESTEKERVTADGARAPAYGRAAGLGRTPEPETGPVAGRRTTARQR